MGSKKQKKGKKPNPGTKYGFSDKRNETPPKNASGMGAALPDTENPPVYGGIYYIDASKANKASLSHGRPGIIVAAPQDGTYANVVTVAFLSEKEQKETPFHIPTDRTGVLATILCDKTTTVGIYRVGDFIAQCTPEEMVAVRRGIAAYFGIQAEDFPAD